MATNSTEAGMIRTVMHEHVAVVTLDAPDRRNAFRLEDTDQFVEVLARLGEDESVRGVVLAATGSAFSAGADRSFLELARSSSDDAHQRRFYRIFGVLRDVAVPVVAAVEGPAVGAGLNLVLACDSVVAGPDAEFHSRFLQVGLHPGGGHCQMLVDRVGSNLAAQMVLFGKVLSAEAAASSGLVHTLAPRGAALAAAVQLAQTVQDIPYPVVVATKRTLRAAAASSFEDAMELERATQFALLGMR